MYWKMSIDLTRPQVASMGHHDPLDGYVTALQLHASGGGGPDLEVALSKFRAMVEPDGLASADPLGIGGLLFDAYRLAQLDRDRPLRDAIIDAAHVGLGRYVRQRELLRDAESRLAFRELGLAIGLEATKRMSLRGFEELDPVRDAIVQFWSRPENRSSRTYREHQDINDVMLATSLIPAGFLVLGPALAK